jgi:hypothetical protein
MARKKADDAAGGQPSPWSRAAGERDQSAGDVPEVLGQAAIREPRARFRHLGTVLVVVVVLGVAGSWADKLQRGHEFDELTASIDSSQQSVSYAVAQVASTRSYTMPLLVTTQSSFVRAGLQKLIDDSAASRVADLQKQRHEINGIRILPWHGTERAARSSYLRYLDARIAALQSIAAGNEETSDEEATFTDLQQRAADSLDSAAHSGSEAGKAATVFASPPPD